MKVLEIRPVRLSAEHGSPCGVIDVLYVRRCGFLWLRKETVLRRAITASGFLYRWLDNPNHLLHEITQMVVGMSKELLAGESVYPQPKSMEEAK